MVIKFTCIQGSSVLLRLSTPSWDEVFYMTHSYIGNVSYHYVLLEREIYRRYQVFVFDSFIFTHAPFRILSNLFIPKMEVFNPMKRLRSNVHSFLEYYLKCSLTKYQSYLKKSLRRNRFLKNALWFVELTFILAIRPLVRDWGVTPPASCMGHMVTFDSSLFTWKAGWRSPSTKPKGQGRLQVMGRWKVRVDRIANQETCRLRVTDPDIAMIDFSGVHRRIWMPEVGTVFMYDHTCW